MTQRGSEAARVREWASRLLATIRPRRTDRELEQELRLHLELVAEHARRVDHSSENAERDAAIQLGGMAQTMEALRDQRGLSWMRDLGRDVRFACRLLASRPGWSAAAILCLAIATGANSTAFSVVNALLLRPLPFRDADQLIMVALKDPERVDTRPFSFEEYRAFVIRTDTSVELLAGTFLPLSLVADDGAKMAQAQFVSANYFDILGIAPLIGRFPHVETDLPVTAAAIVISQALWQRRFGGDTAVVGRTVKINGQPFTISAVAPQGFVGATSLIATDLWVAACFYGAFARAANADTTPMFGVIARMASGVTQQEARARLEAAAAAIWRDSGRGRRPSIVVTDASGFGVPPVLRGAIARGSVLIFGLMALLITVAAANVAALVLARTAGRGREIGVRLALGANRFRIARQMLTESVVLAGAGGVVGWMFAVWTTRIVISQMATPFDYVSYAIDIRPDLRVLLYTVAGLFITAVLFGLAPVWHSARVDLNDVLKRSSSSGRPRGTSRALRGIVVGQMAVSTALLVVCGLLVRSYLNAQAVDPGIQTANIVEAVVDLNQLGIGAEQGRPFFQDVMTRLASLPGVTGTSLTRRTPLFSPGADARVWVDHAEDTPEASFATRSELVTPEHFRLLGIPIVAGRVFEAREPALPLVAIVNETMARQLFPHASPVGRSFRMASPSGSRLEVIGVSRDVKYGSVIEGPQAVFYQPFSQAYSPQMTVLVRVEGRPTSQLIGTIRRQIHEQHPDLAIMNLQTLDDLREVANAGRRRTAISLSIVCVMGLLLSSLGLYGIVSYGVRERARELGIRLALGAQARNLWWMVMHQGLRMTALGLAVGMVMSIALAGLLQSLVFGVSAWDPLTMAIVPAVLVFVSFAALHRPARSATTVDPANTLRYE